MSKRQRDASTAEGDVRHLLLLVEFDGTAFHGWQQQAEDRTVQAELSRAVAAMVGTSVTLRASSRTDAGVHAEALPVAFRTGARIPCEGFRRGLNSLLPADVAVTAVREVDPSFDPRRSSRGKRYRYDVWNAGWPSPLRARRSWWVRGTTLDTAAMQAAASHLLGEHDFSTFRAAHCDAKTPHRRLTRMEVSRPAEDEVRIVVEGDAFLRNMVRILAGTLVDVGRGRRAPDEMPALLAARDRRLAGPTAPPQGLTLERVFYVSPEGPGSP